MTCATFSATIPTMLPDDELLDFDLSNLADRDHLDPHALLAHHGDLYRNHLAIAAWASGWRARMDSGEAEADRADDASWVLGEMVAHLRQGDFLPGGGLWSEISGETN